MFDRQEIERAASEEVLRQMPAAVIAVEAPSGKIIYVNREVQRWTEQVLGQPVPQVLGMYLDLQESSNFKMLHPDGRPYEVEEWPMTRSIRSGEEVRDEEIIHLLGDGTQLWARYDSYPIYDEEGRIVAGVLVSRDITEQKRAEEALQISETRFRTMIEQSPLSIQILSPDGRTLQVNRAWEELWGVTLEDIAGYNLLEDQQLVAKGIMPYIQRGFVGGPTAIPPIMYDPDETIPGRSSHEESKRWVRSFIYPVKDEAGDVREVVLMHEDVTERKQAEEELRAMTAFPELNPAPLVKLDRERRVVLANPAASEFFSVPDLVGRDWVSICPEAGELHLEALYREPGTVRQEINRHGKVMLLLYKNIPESETVHVYGFDITDRKRAEKEVEARTHQQAVVSEIGLWALTNDDLQSLMDDTVAFVAQTLDVEYCKIVELLPSGEELLLKAGAGWEEGLVGQTRVGAGIDSQAGYTLLSEEPVIVEDLSTETRFSPSELLREYGVVSSMTVVIAGRGGPFGVLGVHTKDRRTFSEDDVNFLQAVANVLAMRTEREEADKKLEEVREAERSRIARDLHDEALQNLSSAVVEAEQVRSISEGPEPASRLGRLIVTLKRIGQQLRGAIYDLRLEGEQDRPFSELLESLVELHRGMAPRSNIHLELAAWVLERPLGTTSREVLRIVGEALTNARRHSGAENVWVRVWSSEGKLYAEVSDDGRGFDVAEEPSATPTFRGGIGIRGMNERAHLLGGELKIESEPGNGTKVLFELALEQEQEETKEEKVRVLLVEDHATVRDAIASSFEGEAGFEVVGQAASLAQARTMLEETGQRVDVAMVDLGLPDGYGADLIGELREKNPQAQVLVLSATADRSEIARVAEAGAAGILNKTVHLDEVVETVRAHV